LEGVTEATTYHLAGLSNVFGSLTLGGYDSARFDGTKNVTVGMYTDISRNLLIGLQTVTINSATPKTWSDGIYAFIDSTVPEIWLPQDLCQIFEQAYGLTYDSSYGYYLMNDTIHEKNLANNVSVTLTLGASTSGGSTTQITFPYSAFALTLSYPIMAVNQTSRYFPLKQAANDTQYTLGRTFLQEAYLITDYDSGNFTVAPCVWNTNMAASIKSILPPNETIGSGTKSSSSSSFGAGAIAGVVIGIVALIALIGLLIFLVRRRKTRRATAAASAAEAEKLHSSSAGTGGSPHDPLVAPGASTDRAHTGPPELDGGADNGIHELAEPRYKFAGTAEMDSPHKTDPNKVGYNEMEGEGDVEYFAKAPRNGASEMEGHTPVYEMEGSGVVELPTEFNRDGVAPRGQWPSAEEEKRGIS